MLLTFFYLFLKEFDKAKAHLQSEFRLDINKDVNVFETTIRVMGGLLSAYHLSGDEFFLEKAVSTILGI